MIWRGQNRDDRANEPQEKNASDSRQLTAAEFDLNNIVPHAANKKNSWMNILQCVFDW